MASYSANPNPTRQRGIAAAFRWFLGRPSSKGDRLSKGHPSITFRVRIDRIISWLGSAETNIQLVSSIIPRFDTILIRIAISSVNMIPKKSNLQIAGTLIALAIFVAATLALSFVCATTNEFQLASTLPSFHTPLPVAYIGPGAGFALAGSFLAVIGALFSAFIALLTWPIRWMWRWFRSRKAFAKAKTKRVVILGLDGLDPDLIDEFLEQGILENFSKLKEEGSYRRLGTTWPPLSPVAWSSFSTGTNPGRHNIFDFINRNPQTYLPSISSVRIGKPRRELKLGKYKFPLTSPKIDALRKSKPFWKVLGEAGIFSSVLRVPITFPPDRFHGVQLSAMCVPDLRGTQGTFFLFGESDSSVSAEGDVGGEHVVVTRKGNSVHGAIPGPINSLRKDGAETKLAFKVVCKNESATLHIDGQRCRCH